MIRQKINDMANIRKFKDFILEFKQDIEKDLSRTGRLLIIGDTGGGKTYGFITVCKALSMKNPNIIYVMACPCRSQNEQNQKAYHVQAIIGGKEIDKGTTVASMVYDKAKELREYVIKENKQLVLIIDEAHQLVDSSNFRPNAIEELEKLEGIAKLTIHLTATPSKLLELFTYDDVILYEPVERKLNIKEHSLSLLHNKDIISQIKNFLKDCVKDDKVLMLLNDLSYIKDCYDKLTFEGYKVGICANTQKIKDVFPEESCSKILNETEKIFESIRNKSMLPSNYDYILTTSVLECGTSLNNTDFIPIFVALKPNHIDGDRIQQFFPRFRKEVKRAFTLIPKAKEEHKIKPQIQIFNEIEFIVKKYQMDYQDIFNYLSKKVGKGIATDMVITMMNLDINKTLYFGALEIEEDKIIINQKKLVQVKFKEYFKQFYYNHKEFNKLLKERVKAQKFTMFKLPNLATEEDIQENKELNLVKKEQKEKVKDKGKEILQKYLKQDTNLFKEYLFNEEILIELPKEMQEDIHYLNKEKSLIKLLRKLLDERIPIKESIEILIKSEKKQEVLNYIKKHNYINQNILNDYNPKLKNEYNIYRNTFDEVMEKRGRITKKRLQELTETLINCKIVKGKEKEKYEDILETLQQKKISKANANKLMKPFIKTLIMIYNLSKDEKGYLINSLKINI